MRRLSGGGGSSVKWRRGKNIVSRVGEKMAMTLHIQARHFGVTAVERIRSLRLAWKTGRVRAASLQNETASQNNTVSWNDGD